MSNEEKAKIANISSDFCVIQYPDQTDRFIRTTMTVQINDVCEDLDYGIWVSVSEKTFNEYENDFNTNSEEKTYFGFICNEIVDYKESTLGLHVNIETRKNGKRPLILPHQANHQLVIDFENGITIKEAENRINNMIDSLK